MLARETVDFCTKRFQLAREHYAVALGDDSATASQILSLARTVVQGETEEPRRALKLIEEAESMLCQSDWADWAFAATVRALLASKGGNRRFAVGHLRSARDWLTRGPDGDDSVHVAACDLRLVEIDDSEVSRVSVRETVRRVTTSPLKHLDVFDLAQLREGKSNVVGLSRNSCFLLPDPE